MGCSFFCTHRTCATCFTIVFFFVPSCGLTKKEKPTMKRLIATFATFVMLLLMASCTTPEEKSLRTLQELYQDMEQNHENYTLEDWDKAQAEYELLCTQIKGYQYTDEQLVEIGRLQGKCAAYLTKGYFKRFEKNLIQTLGVFKGYMEGMEQMAPDSSSIQE